MACEYEAAGYYKENFEICSRVEAELAGKKWRSHRAVAKDLKVGEGVYVRDTNGPLAGFIREIRVESDDGSYTITRMPMTEI